MYQPEPTDEQLAAWGMRRSDFDDEPPEEIPFSEDMQQSFDCFQAMSTQWRIGMNGPTGLDYNVLPMLFRIYKIDDEETALNDVRVMETLALTMIHKKK